MSSPTTSAKTPQLPSLATSLLSRRISSGGAIPTRLSPDVRHNARINGPRKGRKKPRIRRSLIIEPKVRGPVLSSLLELAQ